MSIEQKPWFEWMESAVAKMYDSDVDSMALVARLQGGDTLTAYYEASNEDKAAMKPDYLYGIGEDGELYCVPAKMPKPGETVVYPPMTMPKEEDDD